MTREDVLNFARLVLTQCDGAWSRDKKGYDLFDAVTVREILRPDIFGITELSNEEVEYLRLKLLRYKKQIRKLASEFNVPKDKIELGLQKLDEPVAECSVIIHGQVKKGEPYGRISARWVKENLGFGR
jgi:hypothetical protein